MGTAQVIFEMVERGGGATGSHVTGSDRKRPEVTEVIACTSADVSRVFFLTRVIQNVGTRFGHVTPKGWKGTRMPNRKLGFPAVFSGVLTGNDVTRRGVPSGAHIRNRKLEISPY